MTHSHPPTCVNCGQERARHANGGYRGAHGKCATCYSRDLRAAARSPKTRRLRSGWYGYSPVRGTAGEAA